MRATGDRLLGVLVAIEAIERYRDQNSYNEEYEDTDEEAE